MSSSKQTSGWVSATSASRLRTASPTRKSIRSIADLEPEGGAQRRSLGHRQVVQPRQEGGAELMEAGEGQLHLRLDARGPNDPAAGRGRKKVV